MPVLTNLIPISPIVTCRHVYAHTHPCVCRVHVSMTFHPRCASEYHRQNMELFHLCKQLPQEDKFSP